MENLRYEKENGIGILTIARPKALNALNSATLHELGQVVDQIREEADVTCVIVTGEGSKAFVAGADISEMADMNPEQARAFGRFGNEIFRKLELLEVPTIALVNGYALGGGLELTLCCDLILASNNAVFAVPETTLGIICGFGGTQRLPARVGQSVAKRMMFTAERVNAQEALKIGLCDGVTEIEKLMEEGLALAGRMVKSQSVKYAKQAIQFGIAHNGAGFEAESELFAQCFTTGEAETRMKKMLEGKR